jgi:hypothetical protein
VPPFPLEKAHSIGGVECAGFAEFTLPGAFLSVIVIISGRHFAVDSACE